MLDIKKLTEQATKWIASPEGQKAIQESIKESDRVCKKLHNLMKIDEKLLNTPFNI